MAALDAPTAMFAWANSPIELQFQSTIAWPTYQQIMGWNTPPIVTVASVSWQMSRPAYDRAHLARLAVAVAVPDVLRALVADRSPLLVRRAPRPAGRPYGWRRRRKGGRRVNRPGAPR